MSSPGEKYTITLHKWYNRDAVNIFGGAARGALPGGAFRSVLPAVIISKGDLLC